MLLGSIKVDQLYSLTGGRGVITSLCPSLGKMHAVEYRGVCPSHMQEPRGKMINISFFGVEPYVYRNPIRGTDFLVTTLLGKKYKFIPKFNPEKSWDSFQLNQTTIHGMVHQVRLFRTDQK